MPTIKNTLHIVIFFSLEGKSCNYLFFSKLKFKAKFRLQLLISNKAPD